jgi:hypothetical protein
MDVRRLVVAGVAAAALFALAGCDGSSAGSGSVRARDVGGPLFAVPTGFAQLPVGSRRSATIRGSLEGRVARLVVDDGVARLLFTDRSTGAGLGSSLPVRCGNGRQFDERRNGDLDAAGVYARGEVDGDTVRSSVRDAAGVADIAVTVPLDERSDHEPPDALAGKVQPTLVYLGAADARRVLTQPDAVVAEHLTHEVDGVQFETTLTGSLKGGFMYTIRPTGGLADHRIEQTSPVDAVHCNSVVIPDWGTDSGSAELVLVAGGCELLVDGEIAAMSYDPALGGSFAVVRADRGGSDRQVVIRTTSTHRIVSRFHLAYSPPSD